MPKIKFTARKWALAVIIIVLLSGLFLFPDLSRSIRDLSVKALLLPVKAVRSASVYFNSKKELQEQTHELRGEVADLSIELEGYRELRAENERLRELLKFKKKIPFDTISAEIIARNPNSWINSFVIDKGSRDGVQKDSAVCSARGLLGKVYDVSRDSSSVMPVSHPNFRAGGMLKDSRVNGVIFGSGGGMARLMYIPVDTEVEEGVMVLTSGFSRIFPKGIPVGTVVSVGKSRTGLYKYAEIKPFADFLDQEEVLCLK
ncbi:MAG: rod shape-determining protein MreC [Candidatus Omnitrophica bacterium]|nr:rod shape-determining protein MreC [Candidatus Omnitrophota bacterium]MDD5488369.1 rod shape-determining protein MreC [Candidatus Omnitrophota bacterium]